MKKGYFICSVVLLAAAVFLASLFLDASAKAQGKSQAAGAGACGFAGSVTDQNGEAIEGVSITLEKKGSKALSAKSDRDGIFCFYKKTLKKGTYKITFSKQGYITAENKIIYKGVAIDRDYSLESVPTTCAEAGDSNSCDAASKVVDGGCVWDDTDYSCADTPATPTTCAEAVSSASCAAASKVVAGGCVWDADFYYCGATTSCTEVTDEVFCSKAGCEWDYTNSSCVDANGGTLVVSTVDTSGKQIAAPIYVDGELKGTGKVTLTITAGKHLLKFGDLDGYTIVSPAAGKLSVVVKAGETTSVEAVYKKSK